MLSSSKLWKVPLLICEREMRRFWQSLKKEIQETGNEGEKSVLQIYCAMKVPAFSMTAWRGVGCFSRTRVDLVMELEYGGNKGLLGTGKSVLRMGWNPVARSEFPHLGNFTRLYLKVQHCLSCLYSTSISDMYQVVSYPHPQHHNLS